MRGRFTPFAYLANSAPAAGKISTGVYYLITKRCGSHSRLLTKYLLAVAVMSMVKLVSCKKCFGWLGKEVSMRIRRSILATGLMALMAALPLLGTSPAVILSPVAGSVAVNGRNITAGSSIAVGDSVSVSDQGTARLAVAGSTVVASSKTKFSLVSANSADQIRLRFGLVKVTGALPVAVSTATIVPQSKQAQYSVTALNGPVYVSAVTGDVAIRSANGTYIVHAGEAATFSDDATAAQAKGGAGVGFPIWTTIGIAAAAAIITGLIVHYETECHNCVQSPSA